MTTTPSAVTYMPRHDELAARLAMYDPTDECPHCGLPLGRIEANITLDFPETIATYLGLAHRECPALDSP